MSILSRRFILGAAAALPATAAAAAAPALLTNPPMRENRRLLWLGEQLDAVEVAFAAATARKAEARAAAELQWPQPPDGIVFPPGVREPTWCGVQPERDIDDKTVYHFGNQNTFRKVADAGQLKRFVQLCKGSPTDRKNAKAAMKLLAIARKYEDARAAVRESTGYSQANQHLYEVGRRFERIASLIYKTPAQTRQGLEIKARALLAGVQIDVVDGNHVGYRTKMLYAEKLANDVLRVMA